MLDLGDVLNTGANITSFRLVRFESGRQIPARLRMNHALVTDALTVVHTAMTAMEPSGPGKRELQRRLGEPPADPSLIQPGGKRFLNAIEQVGIRDVGAYAGAARRCVQTCDGTTCDGTASGGVLSEGYGHDRPGVWLGDGQTEDYQKDMGMAGLVSVWAMARRRMKEYRRKVDAGTRCSAYAPTLDLS